MNLKDIILSFPKQFQKGVDAANGFSVTKKYARIITCGMGGSAVAGEALTFVRPETVVHWDYGLPANASRNDLVICTSWSGGTEETVSSYERAVASGIDVVAITKGDVLGEMAKQNNTPVVILPAEDIPPRIGVGYMTGALFAVLNMTDQLPSVLDAVGSEANGKALAGKISSKIPLIYTTYRWRKLASLWKTLFNENAKIHAFANWLPSAAHNEIVGFQNKNRDQFATLVLRDQAENQLHMRALNALLAIFDQMRYTYHTVDLSSGGKPLDTVFNNYLFALWTSYYLAKNLGVDPEDTTLIEEFKKLKK